MTNLDFNEIVLILRALHSYEDKLTNVEPSVRDNDEFHALCQLRWDMSQQLKEKAFIK
jgi:hypothetical protein